MGTNVDAREEAVNVVEDGRDVEKTDPTPPTAPAAPANDKEEPSFDSGFAAWLQVLGSWFLFFNSWCVLIYSNGKAAQC